MTSIKIFIVKFLLFIGQRTLLGRGFSRRLIIKIIENIIFINQIKNNFKKEFIVYILGVPFIFFIDKLIGYKFYFCRNERKEIYFVIKNTIDNSVFFDIGASLGMYTQMVSSNFYKMNNPRIIAIEPDPLNCERIKKNLILLKNKIPNIFDLVTIEQCAAGDFNRELYLNRSFGPANGRISDYFEKGSIKVKVKTLLNIIENNNISNITNLKIDVEGYESKVLLPFFEQANKKLYPQNIIIEHSLSDKWDENVIDYLKSINYKIFFMNHVNAILQLKK